MPDDPKTNAETELRAAKPLHCVAADGTIKIIRRTGRPKKVFPKPTVDEHQYGERVAEIAERFLAEDELVEATTKEHDRDDPEVFDRALLELARESAGLAFERQKALEAGKDFAQISSRRVESLGRVASLVALRARIGAEGQLDPRNPKFQKLVDYFMSDMADAAHETLGPDAENFLKLYRERLEGWEEQVGKV